MGVVVVRIRRRRSSGAIIMFMQLSPSHFLKERNVPLLLLLNIVYLNEDSFHNLGDYYSSVGCRWAAFHQYRAFFFFFLSVWICLFADKHACP